VTSSNVAQPKQNLSKHTIKLQGKDSFDPTTAPFAPHSNVSSSPSIVGDFSEYQQGLPSELFETIEDLDLPNDNLKRANEIHLRMPQQGGLDHNDLKFEYDRLFTVHRDAVRSPRPDDPTSCPRSV
jgi:hypothetical protein